MSPHQKDHKESYERLLKQLETEYEKTVEEVILHPVPPLKPVRKRDKQGRFTKG